MTLRKKMTQEGWAMQKGNSNATTRMKPNKRRDYKESHVVFLHIF
jgi:hypothetical protein